MKSIFKFPLVSNSFGDMEITAGMNTLLSGQLTMGDQVKQFEKEFSKYLNTPYSVMVNSGSSANLLVFSAITNRARKRHLEKGDKVAVPAVCWSTSIWPIIQTGLIPVLVDVDPVTLNLSLSSLKDGLARHNIKAIMMVHVLGNSTNLDELDEIVKENNLILIEDTCESLTSKYNNKYLGTIGDFGTFSFYFSHHMTTIEGGMIVSNSLEDLDLLKCLRTHGWSREQSNKKELEKNNPQIDPRFLFINLGYNVRPMELQASFGLEQLKYLDEFSKNRRENVNRIKESFYNHRDWNCQLLFPESAPNLDPCWFGFPFLLSKNLNINVNTFTNNLMSEGIDTRPIVSGNMALQPAVKLLEIDLSLGPFEGAQQIHDRGLFIGCHSESLSKEKINFLTDIILRNCKE